MQIKYCQIALLCAWQIYANSSKQVSVNLCDFYSQVLAFKCIVMYGVIKTNAVQTCVTGTWLTVCVQGKRPWALNYINCHFSPYWAFAQCIGCLQCVKLKTGGTELYGSGTCTLYRACLHDFLGKVQDTRKVQSYVQLSLKVGRNYLNRIGETIIVKCFRQLRHS